MKNILTLIAALMLTASCSYHYYYYTGEAPATQIRPNQKATVKNAKPRVKDLQLNVIQYDKNPPNIIPPTVERPARQYNPADYNTFAVYTKLHTVAAPKNEEDKYAIWCTREGTYYVEMTKMTWNERYMQTRSSFRLRDSHNGKIYPIVKVWGLPMDETYWMHSIAGEWFCRVYEFPPLEPACTCIDILYGSEEPLKHIPGTTGWSMSEDRLEVSVAALQANQSKMTYVPTVVVK